MRLGAGICLFSFLELLTKVSANICTPSETCGDCITTSPLCAWCTQEDFSENKIARCDYHQNFSSCKNPVFPSDEKRIITNKDLSTKGVKVDEAIQIKPQKIKLELRPNSPQEIRVEFRQALDYPVDLYYLMDLSNSMKDDKDNLALLGDSLADTMKNITNNFRIGFGSFVDKVVAPFTNIHPLKIERPCDKCAKPYGFLNNMPLSNDTSLFAKKVNESEVSGNIDAPEGGFDAIMQSVVCKKEIGWRDKSRKLLVFSTDNGFHYAGDGKLAGLVKPNDGICHLNEEGYYEEREQDYPSLSQLNQKVRENSVNIIFAVTEDQEDLYKRLSTRLVGSSTGKLVGSSSNVVELIKDQYNKITSFVELKDNATKEVRVSYQSTCLGNKRSTTNKCDGLKVGDKVAFDVTIELTGCPDDRSEWQTSFQISPMGLNESLIVDLEMICECDCDKENNSVENSPKCNSGNGTYACGICRCKENFYGDQCQCEASNDEISNDVRCFKETGSDICSNRGICRCGKCDCYRRQNPEESVYGKFCECDNFSCDRKDDKICNGHGRCQCGICKCDRAWKGKDCGCSTSKEKCISPFDPERKICSGRGICECGICKCSSSEQEYFGQYCDDCSTCPGKCEEYRQCVECRIQEKSKGQVQTSTNCSLCNFQVDFLEEIEANDDEKLCVFSDEEECRFSFKYKVDPQQVIVQSQREKECPPSMAKMAISIASGVVGGIVLLGLLLLLLWKLITTWYDRREYAKFEEERQKAKWNADENPLYKEAVSTFQNPAYGGK